MREVAWFNTAPERKRDPKAKTEPPPALTRRAQLVKDGVVPVLPEVFGGQYLVDWLFELGPTVAAGAGSGPLTFGELSAWQAQVGLELQPWEVRGLRRLSQDYLSESHAATDPNRPPPSGKRQRNTSIDDRIDEVL